MMKTFFVGVKGVVVKDGKVLILKGGEGRDFWEVPGGRIDGDESLHQTLTRELLEEVPNIKNIQIGQVLDAFRVHRDIKGEVSLTLIFFEVRADFEGDPEISEEHIAWKWADREEALSLVQESCKNAVKRVFDKL